MPARNYTALDRLSNDYYEIPVEGEVYTVAFSPDGKDLVSRECDGYSSGRGCVQSSVVVRDVRTRAELSRITQSGFFVSNMDVSPDSQHLVTGGCERNESQTDCSQ